ncbi:MAG: hypothetical protein K9N23_03420 [Akkermansiaceae bacterium]|nr:hypothetical protein [Akkermansiaceae bacterium]
MKHSPLPCPLVVAASILLATACHLEAASNVTVSDAPTSGGTFNSGNPNVFTPTAAAAVADKNAIQMSLNDGIPVTVGSASAAGGEGDLTVASPIAKTAGADSTLTLDAFRDLALNAAVSSSIGKLPLALTAGRAIASSAPVASNGGDITIDTVQPFTLGGALNAGAGQVLLQSGSLASATPQTVTAASVQVASGAAWNTRRHLRCQVEYGSVSGELAGPAGPRHRPEPHLHGADRGPRRDLPATDGHPTVSAHHQGFTRRETHRRRPAAGRHSHDGLRRDPTATTACGGTPQPRWWRRRCGNWWGRCLSAPDRAELAAF